VHAPPVELELATVEAAVVVLVVAADVVGLPVALDEPIPTVTP
jgi:hypothetical protein